MGGYMESILKVDNLNYAYKDRIIFENLSLNIKKSENRSTAGNRISISFQQVFRFL